MLGQEWASNPIQRKSSLMDVNKWYLQKDGAGFGPRTSHFSAKMLCYKMCLLFVEQIRG